MNNEEKILNDIEIEKILIQLSIYYAMATFDDEKKIELNDCSQILLYEVELAKEGRTQFYFENIEHIVNELSKNIKNVDKKLYIKLINDVVLKMNYYANTINWNPIMDIASKEDTIELSEEIICYSKSLNEIMQSDNIEDIYELGTRYYYAKMYNEAYKCFEKASNEGHKDATYFKIYCMYYGDGIEKNEGQAFKEIVSFTNDRVHCSASKLLGIMYYYGEGTKKDYQKAFEIFKDVENEESEAQYYLGEMYLNGYGVEKNEELGMNYIKKSATRKFQKAIDYLVNKN